jgi:hypothetical protein
VKRIDEELDSLNDKFNQIKIHFKNEILNNQFGFQDFFAHNIYKQELKDGIISKYPSQYFEFDSVDVSEDLIWGQYDFFAVIDEWTEEAPRLKFLNIGNYLLFFKSIYFQEYELSVKAINIRSGLTIDEVKAEFYCLDRKQYFEEDWSSIENYLKVKGAILVGV